MLLNSSSVIPEWTSRYSGICWYFANSTPQSAAESGGTMPTTGFHSVIDRPDRVSRVMPPTTTIKKINAQQTNSQIATAPRRFCGSEASVSFKGEVAAVTTKSRSPERTNREKVTPRSDADKVESKRMRRAFLLGAAVVALNRRAGA